MQKEAVAVAWTRCVRFFGGSAVPQSGVLAEPRAVRAGDAVARLMGIAESLKWSELWDTARGRCPGLGGILPIMSKETGDGQA